MKFLKIILIFTGIFFYSNVGSETKVYVAKKGAKTEKVAKYHKKGCEFLLSPYIETTIKEAKAKGYLECTACIKKEDKSKVVAKKTTAKKSSIAKKRVVKSCTSIKKNGERCRKKTRNSSGRCKLHS